jgi:hypothetical protein
MCAKKILRDAYIINLCPGVFLVYLTTISVTLNYRVSNDIMCGK